MTMKHYVFKDFTIQKLVDRLPEIVEAYNEYGVVVFPGMLNSDANYRLYMRQLSNLFDEIIARKLGKDSTALEIGQKLTLLASLDPMLGKIIAGLGTQHNKLYSFNKIKYSDYLEKFLFQVWGESALLATPQAGDTLHLFPPGERFHRFNLPPHQDYQYLMQSPQQITMYFGISQYHDEVGGLRIWEKSHRFGILPSRKNENGAFEVNAWEACLGGCKVSEFHWSQGDFGIFDSLLAHSSIPNAAIDQSRIVQIFRYSNLNNDVARAYDFASTTYQRASCDFVLEHKDLFVE